MFYLKKSRFLTIIPVFIILIFLLLSFNKNYARKEIVYINSSKIFRDFKMVREMETLGQQEYFLRKKTIDSLSLLLSDETYSQPKENLILQLNKEQSGLENFSKEFSGQLQNKVWSRINTYATEFSRENEYDFVLGFEKGSTVVYGKEELDVTNQFLTFINKKYEGNK